MNLRNNEGPHHPRHCTLSKSSLGKKKMFTFSFYNVLFGSSATAELTITMGSKSVHYFLEWFPAIV